MLSASIRTLVSASLVLLLAFAHSALAFTVTISDKDELRQTCSGMIAGGDSHIEAYFHKGSMGIVATMFYEFADFDKLGKWSNEKDAFGYQLKNYICTPSVVQEKLCSQEQLGNFIVDESTGKAPTVQLQRMDFGATGLTEDKTLVSIDLSINEKTVTRQDKLTIRSHFSPITITDHQRYNVTKTGYYCFGASELPPVPL